MKKLSSFTTLNLIILFSGCAKNPTSKSVTEPRAAELVGLNRRKVEAFFSSEGSSSAYSWDKSSYLDPSTGESVIITYLMKSDAFHSPFDKVKNVDKINKLASSDLLFK
jgi:hypothetical protein